MMSLFSWLTRLYSLDTLDTRFTTSSSVPLKEDGHSQRLNGKIIDSRFEKVDDSASRAAPGSSPSRWNTWEYYLYYFVFITIVPLMFKVPHDVSKSSDPEYPKFAHLLSDGWILGRKVVSQSSHDPSRHDCPF